MSPEVSCNYISHGACITIHDPYFNTCLHAYCIHVTQVYLFFWSLLTFLCLYQHWELRGKLYPFHSESCDQEKEGGASTGAVSSIPTLQGHCGNLSRRFPPPLPPPQLDPAHLHHFENSLSNIMERDGGRRDASGNSTQFCLVLRVGVYVNQVLEHFPQQIGIQEKKI